MQAMTHAHFLLSLAFICREVVNLWHILKLSIICHSAIAWAPCGALLFKSFDGFCFMNWLSTFSCHPTCSPESQHSCMMGPVSFLQLSLSGGFRWCLLLLPGEQTGCSYHICTACTDAGWMWPLKQAAGRDLLPWNQHVLQRSRAVQNVGGEDANIF